MSSLMVIPNPTPDVRPPGNDASASAPGEAGGFGDLVGAHFATTPAGRKAAADTSPQAKDQTSEESSSGAPTDHGAADGQASSPKPAAAGPRSAASPSRAASTTQGLQYLVPLPISTPAPSGGKVSLCSAETGVSTSSTPVLEPPSGPSTSGPETPAPEGSPFITTNFLRAIAPAPAESVPTTSLGQEPGKLPAAPAPSGRLEPLAPGTAGSSGPAVVAAMQQNAEGETVADFLGYQAVVEVNRPQLDPASGSSQTAQDEARTGAPSRTRAARDDALPRDLGRPRRRDGLQPAGRESRSSRGTGDLHPRRGDAKRADFRVGPRVDQARDRTPRGISRGRRRGGSDPRFLRYLPS